MGILSLNANRENVCITLAAQPTAVLVAKQVMMFEGIINHFKFVQNVAVNAAELYSVQFDCVYVTLVACYAAALMNRRHALL